MARNAKYLVYGLIGLAIIGLFNQLFFHTASFLKSILMMLGFAVLLGAIIYYLFIGRNRGAQDANYKKAVKQSRKKYGRNEKAMFTTTANKPSKLRHNRKSSHLTVIKGNKK